MQDNDIKNIFLTQTIDGRFFNLAKEQPDHIAFIDNENTLSYQQLATKVERIASIIQKNLPEEGIVSLYFEQSLEFIICFLAVIRAGKVVVPLEISSPENRLLKFISNAKIKTVIKSDKLSYFETRDFRIISFADLCQQESGALSISDDMSNEVVILYTSGSTGESKGVIHTHRSLMHTTYLFRNLMNLSPVDKCTLLDDIAFFGGVKDILNTFLNGATLNPYSIKQNGYHDLPKFLHERKITVYTSVVTVFRKLCNEAKTDFKHLDLRVVRLGGELTLKSDFEKYKELFPDNCLFISGLATSEAGLLRQNILNKDSVIAGSYISNGYPVEDTDVYIKDDDGVTLEDGMVGTMVISSEYLSSGYKNMPELTAESYRINSVTGKPEYWSGDTGYIENGNLVFAGRKDSMIKVSGRRIDLAEIDSIVMELKGITNAAVLFYQETNSLVLFVEISKTNPVSREDLSQYLSTNLPFYMQPTRVITLTKLPLTASNKVNKRELYGLIKDYERPYVEPTGLYETEVIKVWSSVLNKEKIGIHDNFFELGGDSIAATSATSMIEKIFDVQIPYGYLYQAQTAHLFAKAIEAKNFDKPKWISLINQGGGVPIYWILDGASTLKKYMPDDQQIYVINTHYDHGKVDKTLTVEKICSEFVEEILKVNKGSHCVIGGFSMGATFACEIAQQLKKSDINVDLLILLDPSEKLDKSEDTDLLWKCKRWLKSMYYLYTDSLPPENFKNDHVLQFYKGLRKNYVRSKYDGKVLLMQKIMDVDFEEREWPKVTDVSNLIFVTLNTKDHLSVVNDDDVQLQWTNKIKENI
jgi:acyl-coenzyme A synthetase/AMP-(fatty) acid ligase/acyl carrier protein